jgi:hypothetical protein
MTLRDFTRGLTSALQAIRPWRLGILLLLAFGAGLLSDWWREERVIFPRPLPPFTTIPAGR